MHLKSFILAAESTGAVSSRRPAADFSALRWARCGRQDGKIEGAHIGPHFTPKAKSVIFLFMCGGISHIDTFDPKDNKYAGKLIDAIGFGDNVAEMKRPVIPISAHVQAIRQIGHSGVGLVPECGRRDRRVRRGALDVVQRGQPFSRRDRDHDRPPRRQFDHPTLGAWVSYALGAANQNLPTFVNIGRASSPVQLTGGYLGANVSATPFQPGETPIPESDIRRNRATPPSATSRCACSTK